MTETADIERMKRTIVRREMDEQIPPIEVGDVWTSNLAEDQKFWRRIRILGRYPYGGEINRRESDRYIIYEELSASINRAMPPGELGLIPEFNLRYFARPEE